MGRSLLSDPVVESLLCVASTLSMLLAAFSAAMFAGNLPKFTRWRAGELSPVEEEPSISVLIPARDEAGGIRESIQCVLANTGVGLEVVVLDDGSTDGTGDIVRQIAAADDRVRLIEGIDLPKGWNGKQHACFRLAEAARFDLMLFLDADVRLTPTALQQLTRRKLQTLGNDHDPITLGVPISLLSAFPKQETGTLLEKMLIPMMHFVLLCYLPFSRMRGSTHPAYASGCGQLFVTDRQSYQRAGTHEAIRATRHDGLKLPMAFRRNGMLTDCVDGTGLATCRMYTGAGEVINGLLKNASEGIANKRLLLPFTFLLGGANLLPWVCAAVAAGALSGALTESMAGGASNGGANNDAASNGPAASIAMQYVFVTSVFAIGLSYLPRLIAAKRFEQSWLGAMLHPAAIALFLILQWWAFFNSLRGKQVPWRGRVEIGSTA